MREMAGAGTAAIVIANACDSYEDLRDEAVERELEALESLGFRPREVDLRSYFERVVLEKELTGADLVWVRGGNAFMLREALARSGADQLIVEALAADAFVYGGYSAGVCVLGTDLSIFDTVDDRTEVERAYGYPARTDGLGVTDLVVVPHVNSPDHPESESCSALSANLKRRGIEHTPLRDGDVIIIDGCRMTLCN
jgi:dipeptidase E